MKFGLTDKVVEKIKDVFEENSNVDKAIMFGSRAKGNYKAGSDIDICLKGQYLTFDDILKLHAKLDDLNLAYEIDLLNYDTIKEPALQEHIDRAGIEFYSRWKRVLLGDVLNLKRGYDLPNQKRIKGHISIFSSSGITDYHDKAMRQGPGVITGRYGTIGKIFYTEDPYWPLNTTLYVQDFKGNHPKFIFYFLKGLDFEKYSDKSAVPGINRNEIHKEAVVLPPQTEQIAITSILSSLDDKIDLLQRQNKTLEQLAETLFRQWFVEEAEDSWDMGKIDDVVSIKGGTTPSTKKQEYWNGNIYWTSPRDLSNSDSIFLFDTERKISEKGLAQIGSGLLPIGTVLLSSRAPIGYLTITEILVAINQGYIAIICNKLVSNYFMFLWCKANMNEIENAGNGSVFQEISKTAFKSLDILIPSKDKLKEFDEQIEPVFKKINSNTIQIKSLTKLRDTLLPKLMSGEVRVNN